MGGTAWLLKARYRLHVLCLTKGERGIKGASLQKAAAIREKEEAAACRLLGAKLTFLGQIDGETFADRRTCETVARIMKRVQPAAVFTLWPINLHPDHTTAYEVATKALHLAGRFRDTEVYLSENTIGTQTRQFNPDLYVDISDVVDAKRNLARCHRSQNPSDEHIERVIERNRVRGLFAGCRHAEPFKTMAPLTANGKQGRAAVLRRLG